MSEEEMGNPPIVEALVEMKWELKEKTPIGYRDPHYQLLLGKFHDAIKGVYPFHEALPASGIPDDVTGSVVKHRFRRAKDDWPLVQIGPGIISVNETKKYKTFESFKPKVIEVVEALYDCYPRIEDLAISSLQLRYIDAHEFDYSENNICEFLSDVMHIRSEVPNVLLLTDIEKKPMSYGLRMSFRCNKPAGVASFVLDTGHKLKRRAVIWNQILESSGADVPEMPGAFEGWIDEARGVIRAWFDGIIEGKLKEEFNK